EAKESARTIVAAALAGGGYGDRDLVVRVNAIDTPWGHADLAAAATMPIDAVLLPKVEDPDRVALTVSLLDAFGAPERLAVGRMPAGPRARLRRQDVDPPKADRCRERSIRPDARGGRVVAADHRGARRSGRRGQGRRARGRQADRKPPCGKRTAAIGVSRRDR